MDKKIKSKLKKEERLTKKEVAYLFRDKPYIIALFDQANLQ